MLVGSLLRHYRGGHQRQQPARSLPVGQQRRDDHLDPVGLPTANPALYLSNIDCTTSGSPIYCSAVGAGPTGAVELTSSNGLNGSWSDQTPSGLSGNVANGIPVEINNTSLLPSAYANVVTAGASTNITQLPDLYPFNGGYGLSPATAPPSSERGVSTSARR